MNGLDAGVAAIAADEDSAVETQALLCELDGFASATRMPAGIALSEQIARLNLSLFSDHRFKGAVDDYDCPSNSLLHRVLAERRGLPILLCVIYIEVARRLGITIAGVGFPGHFLVAPAEASPRFLIDPFNGGRVLTEQSLRDQLARIAKRRPTPAQLAHALRPVGQDHILLRINNNLKGAHLRRSDIAGAVRASRRMLMLATHLPGERRELALMRVHLGERAEAIAELRTYLADHPNATEAQALAGLVLELER